MSGTQVSSFYPVNQLLVDNAQQIQNQYAPQRNELFVQRAQQEIGGTEIEMLARGSQSLLALGDEAKMAEQYPSTVAELQRYGFAKNAPSVFPGRAALERIAAMGTSSEKQYERQGVAADWARFNGTPQAAGGATGQPGAVPAAPIPARGTGGPGATAQMPPEYLDHFRRASAETGIPMDVLIAQARQESSFNPNATGAAGEIGIFQIKPSTAQQPGFGLTGVDPGTLRDPGANIMFGARYLKARMGQGDPNNPADQARALAAYNGGGDPNYVANVNRYRPGMSPTDPGAAVTTYTPGGGVAARTGGTDVAGPAGTVPGAVPPPPGAAPGATPAVPAATPAPGTTPPAQQPPAATVAPPAPRMQNGLTADQNQDLARLRSITPTTRPQMIELQKEITQREATYRHQNETADRQYQTDVRTAQQHAQTQANTEATLEFKRREDLRQQDEAVRAAEKARRDKKFTGAPTGYQWNDEGTELVRSPGFQGAEKDERLDYRLDHGDPDSAQYAADYAAKKWQMSQSGNVIENDMSMYRPPSQSIQRPTYLPQPSPQALEDVRKVTLDADTTVQSIDNYLKVLGETDGATLGAFLNNPRDPKAQKLLGAFDAMKMAMRGPSAMNTGVLQPAEFTMVKEDLTSPQTVRGLTGTTEAAGARLGQIKLTLLRKADAELRSVGKDGILVRTEKEFNALPSGTTFYDKNGNRRTKE
jgi:soluble lytic murein transglycosylase-like protein